MKNPKLEAFKEIGRLTVFLVISWIISETLKQVGVIPEVATVKVWLFVYSIPVRWLFTAALTLAGRYADKYTFIYNKVNKVYSLEEGPKGLLNF